ncbi:uncharacterized protein G2W53_009753 [Senna tora]|uniref:Uncharacterized protein n=1 Tax=Senna tora TaxID=362788 RepID=A0A834WYH2_9FABA|nr:uncharacterized protein G2W53_009753 [Senna tora]
MFRLESSWRGRSVDQVLTYSGRQIAVGSQKPSRITRQKTCCASESNTSVPVVFANRSGFDAPIGVVLAWEERGSCLNIFRMTNRGRISETFTNFEAKDLLGKSVDPVLTYSRRQIAVGSLKPSRITRQNTCCASESNTSVRVVFAKGSGFDAPNGVVLAWEERGSCLNIFRTTNRGRIAETFTNFEEKHLLGNESNTSVRVVFANGSGFDAPNGVVLAWEERGSCLNIFQTTNRGRIPETFTNYEAKYLLRKSVDHVLTYSGRQIAVGSQKPSRISRKNTCWAIESNTSVRVVFANESGFDAPNGVVLAWDECGSCLNLFQTTNRGRISETFMNYEAKYLLRKNLHEFRGNRLVGQLSQTRRFALYSRTGVVLMLRLESSWHGRSVDHVLTYSGQQIAVGSQKLSRITRQKTFCGSESNTSVRVVFANRSGFDAPIGVILAREERGSCLNIFRTTNRGRISETFTNYEAKDMLRNESNTSVRDVFANGSGFNAPIGVVSAWEERGSCLNIFRKTNRGRILETFTNYEAKDLLRNRLGVGGAWIMSYYIPDDKSRSDLRNLHELRGKRLVAQVSQTRRLALYSRTGVVLMFRLESSWRGRSVDQVLTYSGRQIAVGSQKPSRITRQKTCCASESNTSVPVVFANRSGFDAPIGVVLAWEERGSCLNIFRMTNRGRISETFTNLEAKDLLGNESNTSVRVVFAKGSGFDAPNGVVLAWEERGSCLNIFRTTNRGRIAETFTNFEEKHLLGNESNTSVRVVFAKGSGFDAPNGVVLAWEERGSCLNIFQTTIEVGSLKPSRITRQNTCCASESNTSVRVVFAKGSGFDAPNGVVLAWEERGSCLNIFRTTNRGRISETFTNFEEKHLLGN